MSTNVSIDEAQAKLREIISNLGPDDEIVITENNQEIARLVASKVQSQRQPRQSGTLRGTVKYMAPDFDAPLDDFREYME